MATLVGSSRRRCPANGYTAVPTTPAVTADDSSRAFVTRRMCSSLRCRSDLRSRRAIPSDASEASGSFGNTSSDRSIGVEHGDRDASRLGGRPRPAVRLALITEPFRRTRVPGRAGRASRRSPGVPRGNTATARRPHGPNRPPTGRRSSARSRRRGRKGSLVHRTTSLNRLNGRAGSASAFGSSAARSSRAPRWAVLWSGAPTWAVPGWALAWLGAPRLGAPRLGAPRWAVPWSVVPRWEPASRCPRWPTRPLPRWGVAEACRA